jgi:hypothetical protein
MMAGGYDTLTVYKESAPCPNRSVLLVQRDHRHNGWSVFLRKVGDGFLCVSTLCGNQGKCDDGGDERKTIHFDGLRAWPEQDAEYSWIPAFAGMTLTLTRYCFSLQAWRPRKKSS